jgi:very-short-patch-repair endonuclease
MRQLTNKLAGCVAVVRQEAIGCYIVDFVCREKKLIVEWMEASTQRIRTTAREIGCSPRTVITLCVSGARTC